MEYCLTEERGFPTYSFLAKKNHLQKVKSKKQNNQKNNSNSRTQNLIRKDWENTPITRNENSNPYRDISIVNQIVKKQIEDSKTLSSTEEKKKFIQEVKHLIKIVNCNQRFYKTNDYIDCKYQLTMLLHSLQNEVSITEKRNNENIKKTVSKPVIQELTKTEKGNMLTSTIKNIGNEIRGKQLITKKRHDELLQQIEELRMDIKENSQVFLKGDKIPQRLNQLKTFQRQLENMIYFKKDTTIETPKKKLIVLKKKTIDS